MKHKILALLLTVLLGVAGPSFAQSARESTHIVRPGETLAVIAARYEVDLNDLAALNGIYNYHRIYSWQELEIPSLSPSLSDEETSMVAEDRSHVIRYGETLGMIAERYGVDLTELTELNDLYGKVIYPGHELLLPSSAEPSATVPNERPVTAQSRQHIVRHGETLGTIAAAYGLNLNELILVNGIFGHIIYPGQALTLPDADGRTLVNAATGASATERSHPIKLGGQLSYIVRPGDTLGDLARHFGITWPAIMRANDIIYPHHIYVGQHLWIPSTGSAGLNIADVEPAPVPDPPAKTVDAATSETSEPAPDAPPPGDYFEHTIQHGETLGILAIHYGLTVQDLLAANNIIHPNHIYVGQHLWIPATAAAGRDVADVEPAPAPDSLAETSDEATTESPAETSEPAPDAPPPGDYFEHTVQFGETLGILAIHYGLTVRDLIAANSIDDANYIESGQTLWIPGSAKRRDPPPPPQLPEPAQQPATEVAAAPAAQAPQTQNAPVVAGTRRQHVVRKGDFLTQLGIDLDTSWIALARLNNLEAPYVLHAGSTLLIPQRADVELYDPAYAAWKWFDIFAHQPGPQVGIGREIVILLDAQAIYAYENGVLQKAVRVSTGKKATPTVKGDHKIWLKRRSQTMSGPGYSLDNVEWVMYFYRDYAIHGTWWHTNFGQPMSHGCVNLTNTDAQWFYEFASIGTPVHVR